MLGYREKLEAGLDTLADNPEMGRLRDELAPGYRSIAIGAHVVVYRRDVELLYIVRILHNRMDPTTQFAG